MTVTGCLRALGLSAGAPAADVLTTLLEEPEALLALLEWVAAENRPNESAVPDVDLLVQEKLYELYGSRIDDAALLRKRKGFGAQNRLLLAILLERQGEWVSLVQLLLANGLSTDTPKRLRELREEQGGWDVRSQGSGSQSRYRLATSAPDLNASALWWLQNNIRNSGLPPRHRILALLKARLGETVPLNDIKYVNPQSASGGRGRSRQAQSETSRRVRELREEGWQVYSGLDKAVVGLGPSDYIMLTLDRLPAYERLKPAVWTAVVKRDGRACTSCGWTPDAGPSQGRKCIEVHHQDPQRARPEDVNDPRNLITLCNVCHDAAS